MWACFDVKADLAILAFGRCVFFASFSVSFCSFHVLSCVCLFVHFYNYILFLMFVQFSAGGSVLVSFPPSSRLFLGLQV